MRKKDLENRLKLIKDQLTLVTQIHQEEFLEKWGVKGVENFVNERLDEYLRLTKLLAEMTDDEDHSK